jgi:primosomal protein N' (replication factor Y)
VQVAGRAGREKRQGEVIIQTAFPSDPFWKSLMTHGYPGIAQSILAERQAAMWPPFTRLALVRATAVEREDAHDFLHAARRVADDAAVPEVRILGPVSAPMERKAGRYRAQLLLQSNQRRNLHRLLDTIRAAMEDSPAARRVRWSIDVDPIELF